MLHSFKSNVDGEVSTARLAGELLNVTVLVVTDAPFDQMIRTTVDTSVNVDWFDDCGLDDDCS
jgi:hypothetical protein